MIENMNDLITFILLAGFVIYLIYSGIKAFNRNRLAKHIRDERKYYNDWEE